MAQNPRFNNSGMFTDASEDYSKITPDNKSEVLATQGNVINSIRVFWNKLKEKLAFAITRADYSKQVGGNYVPIFVDADGVVQECQPITVQASIAQNGIITIPTNDIPNDNIYTGTTVCISVLNNNASGSSSNLQIQHNNSKSPIKYPSGVTVQAKDISKGDLLLATFCKNSTNSSNNFWILLNKINTVVSTGQTTSNDSGNGGHPGLMTAEDKAKLDTIKWSANNYILPKATSDILGGVKSTTTGTTSGRDYNVEVKSDGTMKVNVPWTDTHKTAELRAGNSTSIDNNKTDNGNTYLKIVENGNKSSSLKISGTGGTEVKSDADGSITIESAIVPFYTKLSPTQYLTTKGYTVSGPGSNKSNTNYFLAGNGTWVKIILVPTPTEEGKTLKSHANGTVYWG